jgi:hypothetical protein
LAVFPVDIGTWMGNNKEVIEGSGGVGKVVTIV